MQNVNETMNEGPHTVDFDPTRHCIESRRLAAVNGWAVDGSHLVASAGTGKAGGLCPAPKAAKKPQRQARR